MNRVVGSQEPNLVTDVTAGFMHIAANVRDVGFKQKQRSKSYMVDKDSKQED
jgi:hypothetical protein